MKKYVVITIVLGVILGGIALFYPSRIEVVNPDKPQEVKIEEKVVEREKLDVLIEAALTASSTQIEAEAYQEYLDAREKLENEVMLRVTTEYRKQIEVREAALEEKVSF